MTENFSRPNPKAALGCSVAMMGVFNCHQRPPFGQIKGALAPPSLQKPAASISEIQNQGRERANLTTTRIP